MARKGKDLFELLQVRQRMLEHGGAPRGRVRRTASPLAAATGWLRQAVEDVGERLGRGLGRRRHKGGRGFSGLALLAVVLASFTAGILVGKLLVAGGAPERDLRAAGRPATHAGVDRPQWLPPPSSFEPPDLSREKEVETLSDYLYLVLDFPAAERARASRLAYHLRRHGLETARIHLFPTREEGVHRWATIVFVPEWSRREEVLARLKAVPAPDFVAEAFRRAVRSMRPDDLFMLE